MVGLEARKGPAHGPVFVERLAKWERRRDLGRRVLVGRRGGGGRRVRVIGHVLAQKDAYEPRLEGAGEVEGVDAAPG